MRHIGAYHKKAEDADGDIDIKNPTPSKGAEDETTNGWSEDDADGDDGAHDAEGFSPFFVGKVFGDDGHTETGCHCGSDSLNDAAKDEKFH